MARARPSVTVFTVSRCDGLASKVAVTVLEARLKVSGETRAENQ